MNWTELTNNLSRYVDSLKTRFPNLDAEELKTVADRHHLIAHVADQHDMSPLEAHQEIDDWLFVESLARQAPDIRAS